VLITVQPNFKKSQKEKYMQAQVIEADLSPQVGLEAKDHEASDSLIGNGSIQKMGNVELEQFVSSISAFGDCV
jgi:hypothetical protein